MSKVIELHKYTAEVYQPQIKNKYIKAYASQTRLMGVIGVRVHFEDLILFFHLDYEEYGFDRFQAYKGQDPQAIQVITQSFMGGLGGPLVEINLTQASSLIYEAVAKGTEFFNDVPLEFFEYEHLLVEACPPTDEALYRLVSGPMINDFEAIHYFMMRTTGCDFKVRDQVLAHEDLNFSVCDEPAMLLKNTIEQTSPNRFTCQSIIDYYSAYKLLVTELELRDRKIQATSLLDSMQLSAKEAGLHLSKREYILVCHCPDRDKFVREYEILHPGYMLNEHVGGDLYTLFESNNHHVRQKTFYLNEDVKVIAYMTQGQQVVFACFKEKNLACVKEEIKNHYKYLDIVVELEATNPIVYRFANSGSQDFLEFI